MAKKKTFDSSFLREFKSSLKLVKVTSKKEQKAEDVGFYDDRPTIYIDSKQLPLLNEEKNQELGKKLLLGIEVEITSLDKSFKKDKDDTMDANLKILKIGKI